MPVRETAEQIIRSWHAHETARGAQPIIDYDCAPGERESVSELEGDVEPAASRLEVFEQLTRPRTP